MLPVTVHVPHKGNSKVKLTEYEPANELLLKSAIHEACVSPYIGKSVPGEGAFTGAALIVVDDGL